MISLATMIDDVRQIVEAVSLSMDCDVEVIDENLIRLVATGPLKDAEGKICLHGHGYSHILKTKQGIVVDNPGEHPSCRDCPKIGRCIYKLAIAAPIVLHGRVLGILTIAAFDEVRAKRIKTNMRNLTAFINKMADLLASRLSELALLDSLRVTTAELAAIIDMSAGGIIAVDEGGNILHFNNTALAILNLKRNSRVRASLRSIFQEEIAERLNTTKHKMVNGSNILVQVQSIPIAETDKSQKLLLISFSDYAKVKKSASSIALPDNNITFNDIITRNERMRGIIHMAKKIAASSSTILIRGESGTGKEMFARAIHAESGRSGPLVPINCAAIPETLLESELFGYDPGAFTGASKEGKPGKFELAEGGTLFLDEVGTMPLHLQAKLLRVLEDWRLERLGGRFAIPLNVRVIAASNDDLERKVREGGFREDLFFRINVIPIHLPPLRERREDIKLLADFFMKHYCSKLGKSIGGIVPAAYAAVGSYSWPGNIRELSNTMEFAVNVEEKDQLYSESLPPHILRSSQGEMRNLKREKIDILRSCLERYGRGKRGKLKAAEALGVSLATVYRWVGRCQLEENEN